MVEIRVSDFGELPQIDMEKGKATKMVALPSRTKNVNLEESTPALYHQITKIQAGE